MSHYDEKYFEWQNTIGKFGGFANKFKFSAHIKENDTVLDFGSAGGWLLQNIQAKHKIGIEINDVARNFAFEHNGIESKKEINEVEDNSVDVIISNHVLEHVFSPFQTLIELKKKLKHGGTAVFVVPCESIKNAYNPNDINMHLYTWNPQTLGNLFKQAGFTIVSCEALHHRWPSNYQFWAKFGPRVFDFVCKLYAHTHKELSQVKIVVKNENPTP